MIDFLTSLSTEQWTAFGGLAVAAVALLVSLRATRAAHASARAAERSADEAAKLSQLETERRSEEREYRHELLCPIHPGPLVTTFKVGSDGWPTSLFGTITVTRDYRVEAQAWTGHSFTPVSGLDALLRGNLSHEFHIEPWSPTQKEVRTREVRFRFWPPAPGDDASPWSCPCGRPTGQTGSDVSGHWELRVAVELSPANKKVISIAPGEPLSVY